MSYRFIHAFRAEDPLTRLCQTVGVEVDTMRGAPSRQCPSMKRADHRDTSKG